MHKINPLDDESIRSSVERMSEDVKANIGTQEHPSIFEYIDKLIDENLEERLKHYKVRE